MKKYIIFFAACLFVSELFAFNFATKPPKGSGGSYNYSKTVWTDTNYESPLILSKKPSKNDTAIFRVSKNVQIDTDLQLAYIKIIDEVNVVAINRKIELKKNLDINIMRNASDIPSFIIKNSNLDVKAMFRVSSDQGFGKQKRGKALFKAVDSIANFGGGFIFTAGAVDLTEDCICGVDFYLEGKTKLRFAMDMNMDSSVVGNKNFASDITFREKDKNIPEISLDGKSSNFTNTNIRVRISSKCDSGVFPLIVFRNANASLKESEILSFSVNNKPVKFGQEIEIYDRKIKFFYGVSPTDTGDKKTKNDLLLEIKE